MGKQDLDALRCAPARSARPMASSIRATVNGDATIRVVIAKNGRGLVYNIVSEKTRIAERADVYANRDARSVPDLAPRLKYISWDSYAAMEGK